MGRFLHLYTVKTYSRPYPGREYAYFRYSNSAVDRRLAKNKPKYTVPYKTFLVPVPFPLVTTFETAGMYINGCGLTPSTLGIGGMHYYYATRTSIHIYILVMC